MSRNNFQPVPSQSQTPNLQRSDAQTSPKLLPDLACDCHIHILGPQEQYVFSSDRQYTPMDALVPDAMKMLNNLGMSRAVIIQPSVYGTDNRCTLDAMLSFPISTRAVVAIPPESQPGDLYELQKKGVRGVRLNGIHWNSLELQERYHAYEDLFEPMKSLNWHFELYIGSQAYPALLSIAKISELDLVLDHLGGSFHQDETIEERINALDCLARTDRVWVKLSALYRLRGDQKNTSWCYPIINHLVSNFPHRLIWGSDWPHTPDHRKRQTVRRKTLPFQKIDAYQFLDDILLQTKDDKLRDKIFVGNPEILYDF